MFMDRRIKILAVAILTFCAACHSPVGDRDHRVVHQGEDAFLTVPSGDVFVALDRTDSSRVQAAAAARDTATLENMVTGNKALRVPADTAVKVLEDSDRDRKVRITEGAFAGKSGWVDFQFLRPPNRTDR
jgi:hypothetical protein